MSNLVNEGGAGLFAAATAISTATITADADAKVSAASGLRLMGFSAKETAGVPAAATGRIMNGATAAGGTVLVNMNLALSSSTTQWFGPDGIAAASGLSIDWISGQFDMVLFYKIVT